MVRPIAAQAMTAAAKTNSENNVVMGAMARPGNRVRVGVPLGPPDGRRTHICRAAVAAFIPRPLTNHENAR